MMQRPSRVTAAWRKSSSSNPTGCVQARVRNRAVEVRDSRDPFGQTLSFGYAEWRTFVAGIYGEISRRRTTALADCSGDRFDGGPPVGHEASEWLVT